jgi:hypothetical protein
MNQRFDHLMVFGCSNTLHGHINDEPTSELPKGKFQAEKSWSDWLAKTFSSRLDNYGAAGSANYQIYQKVIKNLYNITDRTLVIVQWSYSSRTIVNWNGRQQHIHTNRRHDKAHIYYDLFYIEDQEISKMLGWTMLLSQMVPNLYFDFCEGSDYLLAQSPQAFKCVQQQPGYLGIFRKPFQTLSVNRYSCSHLNPKGHRELAKLYTRKLIDLEILPKKFT